MRKLPLSDEYVNIFFILTKTPPGAALLLHKEVRINQFYSLAFTLYFRVLISHPDRQFLPFPK